MFHLMGIMYMEKDEKGRDFQNTEMTFEFLWGCGYNIPEASAIWNRFLQGFRI
jgi:hypothetical protein